MNCSLDPGASTSAAFVSAPASGARVITSRIPCLFECLAHRRCSYIFPTNLVPFVEKSLIPDVVVQQADLQRRAGRREQSRTAADENMGGALWGILEAPSEFFLSGVFWKEVGLWM